MVSTVDLIDAGIVRRNLVTPSQRDALLDKAVQLAESLGPSFDSPTGMIWPRVRLAFYILTIANMIHQGQLHIRERMHGAR